MIKLKFDEQLKKLGKNASEIARETGINRNTINSLVNDNLEGIRFETLDKICQTYNLAINDIIDFSISEPIQKKSRKLYKQEAEMVPFTIWPGMTALSQIKISVNGQTQDFGRMDGYFKKTYTLAYWDHSSMNKFAEMFYKLYSRPAQINQYIAEYQVSAAALENLYDQVYVKKIPSVNETGKAYISFWLKSFFLETFDAGYDQEEIAKISKKYGLSKKEIDILATPVELSTESMRRLAILRIAWKIFRTKGAFDKIYQENRYEIDEYKRHFGFLKSNYAQVSHITDEEIIEEIKNDIKDPQFVKSEIKRLARYSEFQGQQIEKVIKKHKLKTNPLFFFNRLVFMREHRNTTNLKGFHILDAILGDIETETGIAKKYLKFLSFEEISSVLKGLVSQKTLAQRYNEGILISINHNKYGQIRVFEGDEAKSIQEELEQEYLQEKNTSPLIEGYTASQGYAKGIAKIILSQADFGKFSDGDILVTGMTKPDFLPLIKKSAAIITNEGGISCDAATSARILNKPCVIGTKSATSAIKDGDMVEVRATDGTVRILKK